MASKGMVTQSHRQQLLMPSFPRINMPGIYNAVTGEHRVARRVQGAPDWRSAATPWRRCDARVAALGSTDGLARGMEVVDTGAAVTVPVGLETLGRVFNMLGEPIDKKGPCAATQFRPIHQPPPLFKNLEPKTKIFETGIKVDRPARSLCPRRPRRGCSAAVQASK